MALMVFLLGSVILLQTCQLSGEQGAGRQARRGYGGGGATVGRGRSTPPQHCRSLLQSTVAMVTESHDLKHGNQGGRTCLWLLCSDVDPGLGRHLGTLDSPPL